MFHLIPAPLHRMALRVAHNLRHRWRIWRGTPLCGCSLVATDLSGAILMLRHNYGQDHWTLPGGGAKRGEDMETAARRELHEEVGISVERLRLVAIIHEEISGSPLSCHLFAAICDQHPMPDMREIAEAKFFPAHSLPEPMSGHARLRLDVWREWRNNNI